MHEYKEYNVGKLFLSVMRIHLAVKRKTNHIILFSQDV